MQADLTEFLRDRLDEDEVVAHTRNDSARMLREVAAKRAILARHMEAQSWSWPPGDGDEEVQQELGAIVRILATVYGGHPDYRQEWKPDAA